MAAHNEDTFAQVNLGLMHLTGGRTHTSSAMRLEWLKKAARKDDPRAIYNLAIAYLRGDGVETSRKTAARHFRKAADLGEENAAAYLAKKLES